MQSTHDRGWDLRLADEKPSLKIGEPVHRENPGPSDKTAAAPG